MYLSLIQTVLTVVFGIAAVASIIVAIRLARRKKPAWAYRTRRIIGLGTHAPQELKLTFSGKLVSDVYETDFVFFNRGNEAIRKNDVTESIIVQFKGAEILRVPTIVSISNEATKCVAKQVIKGGANAVKLDFLYLDHNDGIVIEVMHTKSEEITCGANIIGTKHVKNLGKFEQRYPKLIGVKVSITLLSVIVFFGYLIAILAGITPSGWSEYLEKHPLLYIPFFVAGILMGFSFSFFSNELPLYLRSRKFPKWSRQKVD